MYMYIFFSLSAVLESVEKVIVSETVRTIEAMEEDL